MEYKSFSNGNFSKIQTGSVKTFYVGVCGFAFIHVIFERTTVGKKEEMRRPFLISFGSCLTLTIPLARMLTGTSLRIAIHSSDLFRFPELCCERIGFIAVL